MAITIRTSTSAKSRFGQRGDRVVSLDRTVIIAIAGALAVALAGVFGAGFVAGKRTATPSAALPEQPAPRRPATAVHVSTTPIADKVIAPIPPAAAPAATAAAAPPRAAVAPQPKPSVEAPAEHGSSSSAAFRGKRYVIVAGSFPLESDAAAASADADKRAAELRVKGFRDARVEKIEIPGKGWFFRVIAMEANYPSANAARRDIDAMRRRGELDSAFPALARSSR